MRASIAFLGALLSSLSLAAPPEPEPTARELAEQVRKLKDDVAWLRGSVEALKETLREAGLPAHARSHGFTRAELLDAAADCRVAWDMPSSGDAQVSKRAARKAGLTDAELDAVNRILHAEGAAALAEVRRSWLAMTGEAAAGPTLSLSEMLTEINKRVSQAEHQRALQRVTAERAGLQRAPADAATLPPFERLFRGLAFSGDHAEQLVADKIGTERARRLRDLDGGWSWVYVWSWGCPE